MQNYTFDTPDRLTVELRIPAGDITVKAHDTAVTTVTIDGERSADDVRIDFDPLPDGASRLVLEYRERLKWGVFGFSRDLEVELAVPSGTTLVVETGSAELDVDGPLDSLTFRTGSGDLRFDAVGGRLSVKTASGGARGASVGGDVTFHTASGDLSVSNVGGNVVARTASGDVRLGAVGGSLQVSAVSGDVEVGSVVTGRTSIRTVSGDVEVGVAEGTGVYLDLGSISGDVTSDLEPSPGPAGDADLDLAIATVSGDARVRRAAPRKQDAS
jgi:Putative adhesin